MRLSKPYTDVFPDLCKIYPKKRTIGAATVQHFSIDSTGVLRWFMSFREMVYEGEYVQLAVRDLGTVMSDTHMERYSCLKLVDAARGRVLVTGLGLGMVLFPLFKKKEVCHITVLENEPDVIKLVSPFVSHPKLEIVKADAWEWEPSNGMGYDTIWHDIWHTRDTENLSKMTELHRRYRRHLVRGGWMDSWYRDELRAIRRRELRESRVGFW